MRAEIRAMLDGKKPTPRVSRGVAQIRIKPAPKPAHVGWVIDKQTKEELDARDLAAKIAVYRQQQRIAKAHVTSEKCSHKASALPSQLAAARERADY